MKGKGRVGQRIKQAIVEHEARTMMALFTRLEHEIDGAGQLLLSLAEHLCGTHQHGNMGVMPAGVHRASSFRGKVEPGILVQRKRVHIAAQQHGATIGRTAQYGQQASRRRPFAKLERKPGKGELNLRQCFRVLQAKLRLAMDRAAEFNQIG